MPLLTSWSPWQTQQQLFSRRWTAVAEEPAKSAAVEMPPVKKNPNQILKFGIEVKLSKVKYIQVLAN